MNTDFENALHITEQDTQYDECAKRVLGYKYVQAYIMINVMEEFKETTLEEAVTYIVGEPYISQIPVNPGETNRMAEEGGERVIMFDSESCEVHEGILRFDTITRVRTKEGVSQFIVNMEAQKDEPKTYPLLNRATFYTCRLISSQKERDFTNMSYGDMKPVYSIWINMNLKEDSLDYYHLTDDKLLGNYEWKGNVDLINIVMIGLNQEVLPGRENSELHGFLKTLFSQTLTAEEKTEILETKYQIPMKHDLKKEMKTMCNLSQGIREAATREGIELGKEEAFSTIVLNMRKNKITPEQIAQMTNLTLERIEQIIEENS